MLYFHFYFSLSIPLLWTIRSYLGAELLYKRLSLSVCLSVCLSVSTTIYFFAQLFSLSDNFLVQIRYFFWISGLNILYKYFKGKYSLQCNDDIDG